MDYQHCATPLSSNALGRPFSRGDIRVVHSHRRIVLTGLAGFLAVGFAVADAANGASPPIRTAIYSRPVSRGPVEAVTVGHRGYGGYYRSYGYRGPSVSVGFRYGSFGPRFYGYSPYRRYSYYGPYSRSYSYSYYRPSYVRPFITYGPYAYADVRSYAYSPYAYYPGVQSYGYYQPYYTAYTAQPYVYQPYSFYHSWHGYSRPYCF